MKHIRITLILSFLTLFLSLEVLSQSMYDSWLDGQRQWRTDFGIAAGANTGLQVQFFQPHANRCKYMLKKQAFETGIYYEGLLFKNSLKAEIPEWSAGGIRGELAYLYYPNMNMRFLRLFAGGGVDLGSRKFIAGSDFCIDFVAKAGVEIILNPKSGPVFLRICGKFNRGLNNDIMYFLPEFALVFGR